MDPVLSNWLNNNDRVSPPDIKGYSTVSAAHVPWVVKSAIRFYTLFVIQDSALPTVILVSSVTAPFGSSRR